jgi:hypothetical protein
MNNELQNLPTYETLDSISYELVDYTPHELYHCSHCGRYRHRKVFKGQLPAVCCEFRAKLVDTYMQPSIIIIEQPVACGSELGFSESRLSAQQVLDAVRLHS